MGQAVEATRCVDRNALAGKQQCRQRGDLQRCAAQQGQVQGHTYGDEEQTQQQALEGLDIGLQGVTVLRVSQQHAGQEGAQGHGQSRPLHQHSCADHHQQRGRREDLRGARARGETQNRAQHVTTQHHEAEHDAQGQTATDERTNIPAAAQVAACQGNQRQQRDNGQVLQQQNSEGGTAMIGGQLMALGQHLQHKGGGGQRQDQATHQRHADRQPEEIADSAEDRGG